MYLKQNFKTTTQQTTTSIALKQIGKNENRYKLKLHNELVPLLWMNHSFRRSLSLHLNNLYLTAFTDFFLPKTSVYYNGLHVITHGENPCQVASLLIWV